MFNKTFDIRRFNLILKRFHDDKLNDINIRFGKLRANEIYIDIKTDMWSESISIIWKPLYSDGTAAPEVTLTGASFKIVSLLPEVFKVFAISGIQINEVLDRFDSMGFGNRYDHRTASFD